MGWNENFERVRASLYDRRHAYRAVFMRAPAPKQPWWAFWRKPHGGELSEAARLVMEDLERYCRDKKTTLMVSQGHVDTHGTIFMEGRRDVLLRIRAMLNMTDDHINYIANYRSQTDD